MRQVRSVLLSVSTTFLLFGLDAGSFAYPGDTTPISVGLPGLGPLLGSSAPSVSADGRWICFSSNSPDIVMGDTNTFSDIFLWDTLTDQYARINLRPDGTQTDGISWQPVISGDGRYVAYASRDPHLASPAGNGSDAIYKFDRLLGTTRRISESPQGEPSNAVSLGPQISYDGRYVAFSSRADNLAANDTNGSYDAFVKDTLSGSVSLVSRDSIGISANGNSYIDSISADGRFAGIRSSASNLVQGDQNGKIDAFVCDRATNTVTRVSVSSSGVAGNGDSTLCSVSRNGRRVAFLSSATNLSPVDANNNSDIFFRDLDSGITLLVSINVNGTSSPSACNAPEISDDGSKIFFTSEAWDLVPGDSNSGADAFLHDIATQTTTRMSLGAGGNQLNGALSGYVHGTPDLKYLVFSSDAENATVGDHNQVRDSFRRNLQSGEVIRVLNSSIIALGSDGSDNPSISGDGQLIAFGSRALNLVAGDTNKKSDIFLRNTALQTTERISVSTANVEANGNSGNPSISRTGRFVVFDSVASNLVLLDSNASSDIFFRDRSISATSRVSTSSSGGQANGTSTNPSISMDGRRVVFKSGASNLVDGDSNGLDDIFLKDTMTGITTRISVATNGVQANGASSAPCISSNGRYVAFVSSGTNLVPDDTNGVADVFVRDLLMNSTERASISTSSVQSNGDCFEPNLSHDGKQLTFTSDATNLIPNDANFQRDVFLRDRESATTAAISVAARGGLGDRASNSPSISADGGFVSFTSGSTNLIAQDVEGEVDIFVRDVRNGVTRRVSVDSSGVAANLSSKLSAISGNGAFIVFSSTATNLTYLGRSQVTGADLFLHEEEGSATTVSGAIEFTELAVSSPRPPVTFTFVPTAGGMSTSVPGVLVLPDGSFSFSSNLIGEYDIFVKASTFLRKRFVGSVALSAGPVDWLSFVLTNGDSDGDNEIGVGDYAIVSSTYGLSAGDGGWDARGDIDGDGDVDVQDYGILTANYGLIGD